MKHVMRMLTLVLAVMLIFCAASWADEGKAAKVKKISIETKPDKLVYMIGEEFSAEGGVLKVTYSDKSTALVPMTDSNVTFSGAKLTSEGKKSITIEFGGKSVRLSVTVSGAGYTVTLDENYEGGAVHSVSVVGGSTAEAPEAAREGYQLIGWYTDADFKQAYSFEQPVNNDMTLYACWLKDGAGKVSITFDYDYYGDLLTGYTRVAAAGDTIARPADPVRAGYVFENWMLDGQVFDFTAPVAADMTLVASWKKTVEGVQSYTFEAEDTNMTGKEGIGSSGVSTERSMIKYDATQTYGASNSRWVGYLYKPNLSLDFYFASDVAVADATISLSVGSELPGEFVFSPENYTILLNGAALDFAPFTLAMNAEDVAAKNIRFVTVILADNVPLQAGANELLVYASNNTTINGTTYQAISPLIDSVKIDTSAVLIWDATKGLPANNY